ncbi:MAG: mannose-1-phosphate guanylyltransferase [Thermoleophilia bacterium]
MNHHNAHEAPLAVVIMAGGAGTRFWPVSTRARPKQFLKLSGERSLLQESFDRACLLTAPQRILVLTAADFVEAVHAQLPALPAENVIGEPMRRDTAAAVCLGALLCRRRFGECVMAVLTADHHIAPTAEFARVVRSAARAAQTEAVLYTLGVRPTFPATGYGYLKRGRLLAEDEGLRHYALEAFREKPDAATARDYLASGRYLWNSGMFLWRVSVILGEFERHLPGHVKVLEAAMAAEGTPDWPAALRRAFAELPAVSVDYAVMEKAARVCTVEATFSWSDVGGWLAVEEFLEEDGRGNRVRGRLAAVDAGGNLVFSDDQGELVALLGVNGLVVVRAGRRTLVAHRSRVEDLKVLVRRLEDEGMADDL